MHLSDTLLNIKGDIFDLDIATYLVHAGEN